jgi:ribosomal protein L35
MPKLKSKSGAKKRFRSTGSGKVKANQDSEIVKKYLPYI